MTGIFTKKISCVSERPSHEKHSSPLHALRNDKTAQPGETSPNSICHIQTSKAITAAPKSKEDAAALFDSMLVNPLDQSLQLRAILFMLRISRDCDGRQIIGESGLIQSTIIAMRNFPQNTHIAYNGCIILGNVSSGCEENKYRIRKYRGIHLIIAMMDRKEFDPDFHSWASFALQSITNDCQQNQKEAGARGALEIFQRVLKRYHSHKRLQTYGSAVIGNIASASPEYQRRARESGCVDIVLNAMKNHSSSALLQGLCIMAIMHICYKNEKSQLLIGELGGIELLANSMRRYNTNDELLLNSFAAIHHLCFVEDMRRDVGCCGIIVMIVDFLQRLVGRDGEEAGEEAEVVLEALRVATVSPDENRQKLIKCGGIKKIMNVVEYYRDNAAVVESGLRVFRNICDRGGVDCQMLGAAGVFSFAIEHVERFKTHAGISEHTFSLLYMASVIGYEEGFIGVTLAHVKSVVSQQLETLKTHAQVQKLGSEILSFLDGEEARYAEAYAKRNRRGKNSMLGRLRKAASEVF